MIIKGVSSLRGVRSLNTRPGPLSERIAFLRLYHIAAERDSLLKKLQWVDLQKEQTQTRLSEITLSMQTIEARIISPPILKANSTLRRQAITY